MTALSRRVLRRYTSSRALLRHAGWLTEAVSQVRVRTEPSNDKLSPKMLPHSEAVERRYAERAVTLVTADKRGSQDRPSVFFQSPPAKVGKGERQP